ncbi:hypothetical protein [Desulfofalx alkaliphila]|uniref:hypothetical protein n=1 Tax=Desulfofalx alkaliphila TaxID=105483 RepID=UPI0004E0AFE8|nr:hypothetical protein [Desulfofalx alkaliphila]
MITASKDVFYNILMGEWKDLNIKVLQVSNDGKAYSKVFRLVDFVFDEVEACENCGAPAANCDECDGVLEILVLVGFVNINKRRVEEGVVVPLIGDVLFDVREGHVVILSDTDITVISRAGENSVLGRDGVIDEHTAGITMTNNNGNNVRVKLRLYLVTDNKIKRLALTAMHDGRVFNDLAGKKAVVAELTYAQQDKRVVYLRALRLFYVYFDLDGKINEELTFPKRSSQELPKRSSKQKVVKLGRRDRYPELTREQKDLVKKRLLRDFGQEVWDNTPMRVKAILD